MQVYQTLIMPIHCFFHTIQVCDLERIHRFPIYSADQNANFGELQDSSSSLLCFVPLSGLFLCLYSVKSFIDFFLPKKSFLVLLVNLDKSCEKSHKNLKFVVSDIHTVDKISKTRDSFMASVAFLSKACSTKYQQTNYESGQQIKVA
jgi:hypothetical protein